MEILIKGMEMPKQMETPITITIFKNGSVWMNDVTFGKGKLPNAKAVALPEHELISVHKVLDYLAERAEISKEMGDDATASLFASMGGDILAMSVEASNE